jgi:lipopolysaccharide biosynthesis protein
MAESLARNRRRAADLRVLAFYLPQYHPIRENDEWWGSGFTEWTNVATAPSRFNGHDQPHVPTELGYYDLRVPEVRAAQAELARAHGIDGFVYYHYWFNGHRLLERPFQEVLDSGQPDFPFALCWANENWTRVWDGGSTDLLLEQSYSESDDRTHIQSLLEAFADPRCVRVDGRPLFLVYRVGLLPNPRRTAEIWREEATRAGIGDLYLLKVDSFPEEVGVNPASVGFDGAVGGIPDDRLLGTPLRWGKRWGLTRRLGLTERFWGDNKVFPYQRAVDTALTDPDRGYDVHPCVVPGWDNSSRRRQGGARVLRDSTPERYAVWLTEMLRRESESNGPQLVFINAWNEWAEGNHLEPDRRWGRAYLEATRGAIQTLRHRTTI